MKRTIKLVVVAIALVGIGVCNTYAQKKNKLIKAVITQGNFNLNTSRLEAALKAQHNLYVQEQLRLYRVAAAQMNQAQRLEVLANAQKFVAQTGRWMRIENANLQEAKLAKEVNVLLQDANPLDPTIVQLRQLRNTIRQAQVEKDILTELETFVAQQGRLPRKNIRAVTGALNRVEDMSAEQIAEFKLARQVEYILDKDPDSDIAQQIKSLKDKWDK